MIYPPLLLLVVMPLALYGWCDWTAVSVGVFIGLMTAELSDWSIERRFRRLGIEQRYVNTLEDPEREER